MTPRSLLAPARLAGGPILRSQTDERLVDLARAGYEPAFEAIVTRYRRPLLRYCSRFLSEERAEDAVQQTFVSAYAAMKKDESELRLRPWLYRIAHNTALNALRDRGLRHEELAEEIDGVERPDQALERREGLRTVLGAVQELPERQRDAIVLRELEGRSYEQIADELGVTGGAVRQLLSRARSQVRAAATAVTPIGLIARLPAASEGEPMAARIAELTATAGAGAVATKVAATALVTGAVIGGAAAAPEGGEESAADAQARPAVRQAGTGSAGREDRSGPGERSGRREDDDRSGRGGGSDDRRDDDRRDDDDDREDDGDRSGSNSGPGSGDDDGEGDNSGPGSDDSDSSGRSGSDRSGSGSGGSGSGSGSSGSDSGSSGSGSGSSGPGSGDSTSGDSYYDSQSGDSGSGDSGGTSGSGSG